MNSLRKAKETVIPADENINIYVQSLVKIYERENRWTREWRAGFIIRERLGLNRHFRSWKDMTDVAWQFPVFGFLAYFTYFYLHKGFWIFLFSMAAWFFLSAIWTPFKELFTCLTSDGKNRILKKFIPVIDFTVFWIIPLLNCGSLACLSIKQD